jgi:thymidylate synthase ThyX
MDKSQHIGKTIKCLDKGFVKLIDYMGDDNAVVQSARVSYGDGTKTVNEDRGLIRYLLRHYHTTPFEMCLAGNSKVYTSGGYRSIKELSGLFKIEKSSISSLKVLTVDTKTETITQTKIKRVWNTGKKMVYKLTFSDNLEKPKSEYDKIEILEVTDNHPILMANGEYKSLKDGLTVGNLVWGGFDGVTSKNELLYFNRILKLISIVELEEQDVYDLEVESENHNFLVNGIFVHNCEFKFHIKLPIFVARQWIRHRTACLSGSSEISIETVVMGMVTPRITKTIKELYEEFTSSVKNGDFINPIKNLRITNLNEDKNRFGHSHITDIWESGIKDVYNFKFDNDSELKCTKDHLVYTNIGWVRIEEVEKNIDIKVYGLGDVYSLLSLVSVDYVGKEMTYDLSVAGEYKNFVANGIVVHNSVNEYSGRYSIMKNEFYLPETDRMQKQSATNKQGSGEQFDLETSTNIQSLLKEEQDLLGQNYDSYIDQGLARELARINLPLSTYTEWYWKIDLHNLFHFIRLRADSHAQQEIVEYANAICELIKDIVPNSYEAFEDYRINSMNLSGMEKDLLGFILKGGDIYSEDFDFKDFGLTKREFQEFEVKYKNLIK